MPNATADVGRGHADLMLGNFQVAAENLLHLERRLVRMHDGERAIARIEVGDEPARFERHGHLALEAQLFLDHDVSVGESLCRLALLERKIECDVVAELGMDDRRARRDGLQLIADRGQGLPFGGDELCRILGLGAALGHHDGDRLALPDCALGGHEMLRRRTMPWPVQRHADEGLASRVDLGRGEHSGDARRGLRGRDVERDEPGVRVRAAHEAGMQHPRQLDVVDVTAVPAEQALELTPRNARTDTSALQIGGTSRRCCIRRHQLFPRSAMTASTASTMAW